ncbi:MAG: TetR/AcrR family transcriptional regulator [Proteobacteria bacterium]|nr:TetR/AcrR family transcriptional regulator [Pseudomonadota bacterium]HQR03173.1 TetR/AcrR family transcriptional regulator [Rhodocyclaceae bacterium]
MTTPGSALKRRSVGRPAKTSRDEIIACAIAILEREPTAGVSLNRIARDLGLTPMALYTYFSDRDELLQAISARLLENFKLVLPPGANWEKRLRIWSCALREMLIRYPHLAQTLGWEGHTSAAWTEHMALVFDCLAEAGLHDRTLSQSALWVLNTTIGNINAELAQYQLNFELSDTDISHIPASYTAHFRGLQHYSREKTYHEAAFQFHLDRLIAAIASLAAESTD